jgi:cardiolipin synthase
MLNVPNVLTLLRLALIPVVGYCIAIQAYAIALPVFLVGAVTDLADGYIARRFGLTTRIGATLDPIADKLNMFVATVMLAWQGWLPLWLAAAIVGRDAVILTGALAYRLLIGTVEVAPTMLSKINTVLEFALLLLVMAAAAGWVDGSAWLPGLFMIVFATVIGSGLQYVWVWGRKALRERHAR